MPNFIKIGRQKNQASFIQIFGTMFSGQTVLRPNQESSRMYYSTAVQQKFC